MRLAKALDMEQLELTGSEADGDPQSPKGGRATGESGVDDRRLHPESPSFALLRLGYAMSVLRASLINLEWWLCRLDDTRDGSKTLGSGPLSVSIKRTSTTALRLTVEVDGASISASDDDFPESVVQRETGYDPDDSVVINEEEWNDEIP